MFLYTFSKLFNCGIFSICLQILLHILYSSFPSPVPFFKITGFLSFSIYGKGFYHRIFHLPYHQHIEYYFLNCPRVKASSLSNSFSKKYFLLENFALPDFGFPLKTHPPLQSFPFSSEIIYIGELFILSYLEYEVPVSDVFFGIDIIIAPGLLFVNTFFEFYF